MRAFPLPEPVVIHARSAALLIDDQQQEDTEATLPLRKAEKAEKRPKPALGEHAI